MNNVSLSRPSIFFFVILLGSLSVSASQENNGQQQSTQINGAGIVVNKYKSNRAEFYDQREKLSSRLQKSMQKVQELTAELATLQQEEEVRAAEKQIGDESTESEVSKLIRFSREAAGFKKEEVRTQIGDESAADVSSLELTAIDIEIFSRGLFYPLGSIMEISDRAYSALFFMLTLTTYGYIRRRQKEFFENRKHIVHRITIFLLLAFPLSSFAQGDRELTANLEEAGYLLGLTKIERYTKILENPATDTYHLPDLGLSQKLLAPFALIHVDTAEYYYSLAALQVAKGSTSDGIDSLKKALSPGIKYNNSRENKERMVAGAISFLIQQGQLESAGNILNDNLEHMLNQETLIALYKLFKKHRLTVSSEKIADQAVYSQNLFDELVSLAVQLYDFGEKEQASAALIKSVQKIDDMEQVKRVAQIAVQRDSAKAIVALMDRVSLGLVSVEDYFEISDFFQVLAKREESLLIITDLISITGKGKSLSLQGKKANKFDVLSYISIQALTRGYLEQAATAARKLAIALKKERHSYMITLPENSALTRGLPNPTELPLPLYYGLLYDEMGLNGGARSAYVREVKALLGSVIDSKGTQIPFLLNHFSLLGEALLESQDLQTLSALDKVFVELERYELEKGAAAVAQIIKQNQIEIDRLQSAINEIKPAVQPAKSVFTKGLEVMERLRSKFLTLIRAIALILLTAVLVGGCIAISHRHAKQRSVHRTYAFFTKFNESVGWIYVLTIVGVPYGILYIIFAQFLQLFQVGNEGIRRLGSDFEPRANDV